MTNEPTTNRSVSDLINEYMSEDHENAVSMSRALWLSHATLALRAARLNAGLSQQALADKLRTTQSAIARIENDTEGRITLHKYIDFAIACGIVPFDLSLTDLEQMIRFVRDDTGETEAETTTYEPMEANG